MFEAQPYPLSTTLPTPKVILFDWDDTLIQTWPNLWQLYQELFPKYGISLPPEPYCRDMAVRGGREFFKLICGDVLAEKIGTEFLHLYKERYLPFPKPEDGAEDVLKDLYTRGIPLGIVSNKDSRFLSSEISKLGWVPFFQAMTGRDTVGLKPNPKTIFHTLEVMKQSMDVQSVWFIGDSTVDEKTAMNAGCSFLKYGNSSWEAPSPAMVVANWTQFYQILKNFF